MNRLDVVAEGCTFSSTISMGKKEKNEVGIEVGKEIKRNLTQIWPTPFPICPRFATVTSTKNDLQYWKKFHPKTLIEMWITCLDPVSANSEKGRDSEWAVRMGQGLPSRFGQSGAARELDLVQIVMEAPEIRGGLPST